MKKKFKYIYPTTDEFVKGIVSKSNIDHEYEIQDNMIKVMIPQQEFFCEVFEEEDRMIVEYFEKDPKII